MSYVRKIRLEYYEVVCKKNVDPVNMPDRPFDLNLWIEKAGRLSLEARTFDYYQEQARLDKFWPDKVKDYWFLNFIRLRETNIPTTVKIDKESEPLVLDDDEYIGEEVNALYDEKLGILMLQRNRFSLGVEGIEKYLNLLWNSDEETIHLRPICPLGIQQKAEKAFEYRKFTVRFADVKNNDLDTNEMKPFKKIFNGLKEYEAINAEITVTMGYSKNESLHKETVRETINEVIANKGIISKAEISVKETDDSNVEVIDLFADKMHDFIFVILDKRESLASEYVASHMIEKYDESKGELVETLRVRENEI